MRPGLSPWLPPGGDLFHLPVFKDVRPHHGAGVIVAVIATFIGYIFAYTITRTNVPCKGFLKTIATLPGNTIPPFILCLSIIFCSGGRG